MHTCSDEAACSSWLAMEVADAAAYKLLAGKLLLENSQESLLQKLTGVMLRVYCLA